MNNNNNIFIELFLILHFFFFIEFPLTFALFFHSNLNIFLSGFLQQIMELLPISGDTPLLSPNTPTRHSPRRQQQCSPADGQPQQQSVVQRRVSELYQLNPGAIWMLPVAPSKRGISQIPKDPQSLGNANKFVTQNSDSSPPIWTPNIDYNTIIFIFLCWIEFTYFWV